MILPSSWRSRTRRSEASRAALAAFQQALDVRDPQLVLRIRDPRLRTLEDDPRFRAIFDEMRL